MSQQSAFLKATAQTVDMFKDSDQLDLANQIAAAAEAILASDLAHISTAIRELTADKIVEGTRISPDAIVLPQVKDILTTIVSSINPPAEEFAPS